MVQREKVFRHGDGATREMPRVRDCLSALGFASADVRQNHTPQRQGLGLRLLVSVAHRCVRACVKNLTAENATR
jgi:hypothetical protein